MMWIVRLALKHTYTFIVMALLITVIGGVSIYRMSTDIFPEIDIPVVSVVWQYFGIPMVFLYSALLAVPNELVEAANIDGAGGWTTFWKIKFPLIAPQFGLIAILTYMAGSLACAL